jgi:hypothetical protein
MMQHYITSAIGTASLSNTPVNKAITLAKVSEEYQIIS